MTKERKKPNKIEENQEDKDKGDEHDDDDVTEEAGDESCLVIKCISSLESRVIKPVTLLLCHYSPLSHWGIENLYPAEPGQ